MNGNKHYETDNYSHQYINEQVPILRCHIVYNFNVTIFLLDKSYSINKSLILGTLGKHSVSYPGLYPAGAH